MSTIITRAGNGSALTHNQLDTNFKQAAQAKAANYTVAESDNRDTIECSGTFSVTLPDAAAVVAAADTGDFEVTIKNTGSGVITIARTTGTDTIDGTAANITISGNESVVLKANQAGNGYNNLSVGKPTLRGATVNKTSDTALTSGNDVVWQATLLDTDSDSGVGGANP